MISDNAAQTMFAGYTWPKPTAAATESPDIVAQKMCLRKVSSRSGLALCPLGVTTKPSGRRNSAPTKAVE